MPCSIEGAISIQILKKWSFSCSSNRNYSDEMLMNSHKRTLTRLTNIQQILHSSAEMGCPLIIMKPESFTNGDLNILKYFWWNIFQKSTVTNYLTCWTSLSTMPIFWFINPRLLFKDLFKDSCLWDHFRSVNNLVAWIWIFVTVARLREIHSFFNSVKQSLHRHQSFCK